MLMVSAPKEIPVVIAKAAAIIKHMAIAVPIFPKRFCLVLQKFMYYTLLVHYQLNVANP